MYRIVKSSNTSCLEAHPGIYGLLMKGIFDAYVLWPFDKKLISWLVSQIRTGDFTVCNSSQAMKLRNSLLNICVLFVCQSAREPLQRKMLVIFQPIKTQLKKFQLQKSAVIGWNISRHYAGFPTDWWTQICCRPRKEFSPLFSLSMFNRMWRIAVLITTCIKDEGLPRQEKTKLKMNNKKLLWGYTGNWVLGGILLAASHSRTFH